MTISNDEFLTQLNDGLSKPSIVSAIDVERYAREGNDINMKNADKSISVVVLDGVTTYI